MSSDRREERRAARQARHLARQQNPAVQILTGVFVIGLGLIFLLDNLGFLDFRVSLHLLPLFLVFAGILKIVQSRSTQSLLVGGALIVVGALLTLRGFGLTFISWRTLWPLLLIAAGVSVVLRSVQRRRDLPPGVPGAPGASSGSGSGPVSLEKGPAYANRDDDDVISVAAVMGGFERRLSSQAFRGGEINVMMGSCELDLRQCRMGPAGEALLNVFAIFGGIQIKVPPDWTVILQGTPLMGGFEEKTIVPPDASKRLIVRGYAIMGGLEVRN